MVGAASALVFMPPPGIAPLAGYTVAVASDRRRMALADLVEARGGRSVSVQAVRAITTADEAPLKAATEDLVAGPIDEFIVSANFGFAQWLRAAARWGLADAVLDRFRDARLLAASARAADGLRDAGFTEIWSTAAGTTEELVRYLLAQPIAGRRIGVHCDGPDTSELCLALRRAGAEVIPVETYRCAPPAHADILRRLAEQIATEQVDAVVFTAAECANYLIGQARVEGRLDAVCNALAGDLAAVCRGDTCAAPLRALGVAALAPTRPYFDEVIETVISAVSRRALTLRVNGHRLEVRGQAVILGDQLVAVQPGPIGVLRALARHPGHVLSIADIRRETPSFAQIDDHAIEMAVSRLRRSLTDTDMIQTVVKRGYRLSV